MRPVLRKFKLILFTPILILIAVTAVSQQAKHKFTGSKTTSSQLKAFYQITAEANVEFIYPPGFKEIPAINNENFSFDYAMVLPGYDFEIWFKVRSQKRDWADYQRYSADTARRIENPDSLYNKIGPAHAVSFTGDKNYFTTIIPQDVLVRYNANAGKTYLLNLLDMRETKHYKYALLITLEKDHIGTIEVVCFANDKGADFFKNIFKASKCLKFKP
jgi:hypothetical protein